MLYYATFLFLWPRCILSFFIPKMPQLRGELCMRCDDSSFSFILINSSFQFGAVGIFTPAIPSFLSLLKFFLTNPQLSPGINNLVSKRLRRILPAAFETSIVFTR
ncbi:hypothetical protein BC829DRAFT_177184 [Chytridium lagenaria]|nr:hypothetical protein BC829DRAFT_177184 [Chytridium lagenaria]